MKLIGKCKMPALSMEASAYLLQRGGDFNRELHRLPSGETSHFPKGVYRCYKTHEEANAHWDACVIAGMVRHARD